MIEKVFLDTDGHIWFKSQHLSNWYDHPSVNVAKRARQDSNGHPRLAGIYLAGVMISDIDADLQNRMQGAIRELSLPEYLMVKASSNLNRVLPALPH
ncbi:hypothetical protein I7Z51_002520 [Vibrio parahaemolyticus]|uniref:hypothetical protein n=1 Tax=Vibrio TaxID=662 RepID=UPI001A8DB5DA|nr:MULTISPECIES: hypothetical protein [Vibrio]EGQ7973597.1 hypothetical protein [Vibrio parahaemolyticus]MBO0209804.1 hypothetical protein [Vibrio sp. Vb0877]MCR9811866.1 hypothetical protein [Vibrio parahaemolyticus]MDW2320274.1 hypothetical protein [Vibrio sp. 1159]